MLAQASLLAMNTCNQVSHFRQHMRVTVFLRFHSVKYTRPVTEVNYIDLKVKG